MFFKFDIYLFSTGTATTNKLDDGILVVHFWNLKYRDIQNGTQTTNIFIDSILESQTNPMMVHR